jgi:hypothetical protein
MGKGTHTMAGHSLALQEPAVMLHDPTCSMVDTSGFQFSPLSPDQVPSRLRHTLPQLYRLGLKRTEPPPVVRRLTCGGCCRAPNQDRALQYEIQLLESSSAASRMT